MNKENTTASSRPILFRAWDGKKMHTQNAYAFVLGEKGGFVREDEGWIFQQYTGLHDKNGKEIFEGDVVRHRFEDYEEYDHYKVEWRHAGFFAQDIKSPHHLTMYNGIVCEVIGNIYENPELLKS